MQRQRPVSMTMKIQLLWFLWASLRFNCHQKWSALKNPKSTISKTVSWLKKSETASSLLCLSCTNNNRYRIHWYRSQLKNSSPPLILWFRCPLPTPRSLCLDRKQRLRFASFGSQTASVDTVTTALSHMARMNSRRRHTWRASTAWLTAKPTCKVAASTESAANSSILQLTFLISKPNARGTKIFLMKTPASWKRESTKCRTPRSANSM